MDWIEVILIVAGGLGLFLYAVMSLGDVLERMAGQKVKYWLSRFCKNDVSSVLTGGLITLILDSSSAVIIMTIVLANAKTLRLRQALGIVLGANIGTTFSSQLIALDIGKFSPLPIVVGLILLMVSKNPKVGNLGKLILYMGMLFFGLFTMERGVEPLRANGQFADWMLGLQNPWKGSIIGGVVTLIIQSSSATVGMVITLAKKGLISLSASLAVMLGAELGTCADTLLATIGGSRTGLKIGLFHLGFNLASILIGLCFFQAFVSLVQRISGNAALEQVVANGHMLFNIGGALLCLPLLAWIEKLLHQALPDRAQLTSADAVPALVEYQP